MEYIYMEYIYIMEYIMEYTYMEYIMEYIYIYGICNGIYIYIYVEYVM